MQLQQDAERPLWWPTPGRGAGKFTQAAYTWLRGANPESRCTVDACFWILVRARRQVHAACVNMAAGAVPENDAERFFSSPPVQFYHIYPMRGRPGAAISGWIGIFSLLFCCGGTWGPLAPCRERRPWSGSDRSI